MTDKSNANNSTTQVKVKSLGESRAFNRPGLTNRGNRYTIVTMIQLVQY